MSDFITGAAHAITELDSACPWCGYVHADPAVEEVCRAALAAAEPRRTLEQVEAAEADAHFDLLVARGERDLAHRAIRDLLQAYSHVFACELSTTEQQIALQRARAVAASAENFTDEEKTV